MSSTLAFVAAILVSMAVNEFSDLSPWLAKKVLRWSARHLRDPELSLRYEEEWLADLEQVAPGSKLTKLGYAVGVAVFGVLKLRARGHRLDWEPRPIVSPFATDSLFGPGNPILASRSYPIQPGVAPEIQPKSPLLASTEKPLGVEHAGFVDAQADWEPPPGLARRRREHEPPPLRNVFAVWHERAEDQEHPNKMPCIDQRLFILDQATAVPVIGAA